MSKFLLLFWKFQKITISTTPKKSFWNSNLKTIFFLIPWFLSMVPYIFLLCWTLDTRFYVRKTNGIFCCLMKFLETLFFFQLPIKKVGFITLILSKFQIINANLWTIYSKDLNLWSMLLFVRFEKLIFSDFWGPLNLLGPSKKTQLLDSWSLSMH